MLWARNINKAIKIIVGLPKLEQVREREKERELFCLYPRIKHWNWFSFNFDLIWNRFNEEENSKIIWPQVAIMHWLFHLITLPKLIVDWCHFSLPFYFFILPFFSLHSIPSLHVTTNNSKSFLIITAELLLLPETTSIFNEFCVCVGWAAFCEWFENVWDKTGRAC